MKNGKSRILWFKRRRRAVLFNLAVLKDSRPYYYKVRVSFYLLIYLPFQIKCSWLFYTLPSKIHLLPKFWLFDFNKEYLVIKLWFVNAGEKFGKRLWNWNHCCVIKYNTANGINNITVNLTYFFFFYVLWTP